jgi:hypothetical protein
MIYYILMILYELMMLISEKVKHDIFNEQKQNFI